MKYFNGLWTATSSNTKTGNVPTLWVGETLEESRASCEGCAQLVTGNCYAQYGTPRIAMRTMEKANRRGKPYGLRQAIANSARSARMARFGALGDPSRIAPQTLRAWFRLVKATGLDVIGYTHFWREDRNQWLKSFFMASCDTLAEAEEAAAMGWRTATVVPADYPEAVIALDNGDRAVVCPALRSDRIDCNSCRLCNPQKAGPHILFKDHGPKSRGAARRKARALARAAARSDE